MKVRGAFRMKYKALLLIVLGILALFMPKKQMTFGERWKYKSKIEPSDSYVLITRVSGIFLIIGGIFSMLYLC